MHFIIAPGAWSSYSHFEPFINEISGMGHTVHFVKYPGSEQNSKVDSHEITYENYALALLNSVEQSPSVCCIILHSMSGMLTAKLAKVSAKIKHIFLVAAYIPLHGQSMIDQLNEVARRTLSKAFLPNHDRTILDLDRKKIQDLFFNQLDVNKRAKAASELFPQVLAPMKHVVKWDDRNSLQHKMTYFVCCKDKAIPPEGQRFIATQHQIETIDLLEADHFPFFSCTNELINRIFTRLVTRRLVSKL